MKIIECPQNSPEWHAVRLGKVTASQVDALVSPLYAIRKGDGARTYLYEKVCEKVLNSAQDSGGTWAMSQGQIGETLALPWYEFHHGVKLQRVGFCMSDDERSGFSPDALCGEDGGVEVKCPQPALHLSYLDAGEIPKEYRMQVQMALYISKRQWWDFVSYSPFLPPLVIRAYPNAEAFNSLEMALTLFYAAFDSAYSKIMAKMPRGGRPD